MSTFDPVLIGKQVESLQAHLQVLLDLGLESTAGHQRQLFEQAGEKLQALLCELLRSREKMQMQNAELAVLRFAVEEERRRYQQLFESIPQCLLLIETTGRVVGANPAVARLLGLETGLLVGRHLREFVVESDWPLCCRALSEVAAGGGSRDWTVGLRPAGGSGLRVAIAATPLGGLGGGIVTVQLHLRPLDTQSAAPLVDEESQALRPLYVYYKGEVVPMRAQSLWLVRQGYLKLSTFRFSGEEVLVGLVGPSTVFGTSLTGLQSYQALALTDVQLVSYSIREVEASPALMKLLAPLIRRRLQQAEAMLAIAGQLQAESRLRDLLVLLAQEIGEPAKEWRRLSVRLTHQDLANAIGVTRVTVSNQLNKLKKSGLVSLDARQHLLVSEQLSTLH